MSESAPFAADRYELELAEGGVEALIVVPLPESEAPWLGEAFAAIDPWASYACSATTLGTYLTKQEPGAPRFLLKLGGRVAGAAGVRLGWLRGPYIQFLGVLPGFQRRGLGSAVLAWAEREARSSEERNLWVAASDINADAIRFYARHGFGQAARLEGLVCDGRTEILLRKRLTYGV